VIIVYYTYIYIVCHSVKYVYHRRMEICFKFYYDKETWVDAEKRCNGDNGKLISLQNKTKFILFINFLQFNKGIYRYEIEFEINSN